MKIRLTAAIIIKGKLRKFTLSEKFTTLNPSYMFREGHAHHLF